MSKIAHRTLFWRMLLAQLAGLIGFVVFAGGALLAILPLYLNLPEGTDLSALNANPSVSLSVGISLFFTGLISWVLIAMLIANRMNGIIEWILHRIGIRFRAVGWGTESVVPRVLAELEGWQGVIDAKMSDLLIQSAIVSGQVFLHEFGNYLDTISLRTSLVSQIWQGPPGEIEKLKAAIRDAAEFLGDLRKWIEGCTSDMSEIDVLAVVREIPRKFFVDRERLIIPNADFRPPVPPVVHAMKGMLVQVLLNLIRNALEYSKDEIDNKVTISVQVALPSSSADGGNSGQVVLRVEDSAHMDDRAAEELFIVPPAPAGPRTHNHFRLGLPLCRAYMQAMGGAIIFYPANGNSNRKAFEITLPLYRTPSQASNTKE